MKGLFTEISWSEIKAFVYNDTKLQDYVQIPWDEITYVIADVYFGGKFIHFEIRTKQNGRFRFASRKSRITLKEIQKNSSRKFKKST